MKIKKIKCKYDNIKTVNLTSRPEHLGGQCTFSKGLFEDVD